MDKQNLSVTQIIDLLFQPGTEILNTNLARLSSLKKEDIDHFHECWKMAGAELRLRLITAMVGLSENDFALDFTGIFKLALDDGEESIRSKAVEGLELEDKQSVIGLIIKTLKNDDSIRVRMMAAQALGKFALMAELDELPAFIGQDIFNALLEALENPGEPLELRRRALESIAAFQQDLISRYIEDYYYNDDPEARASAIYAMGRNCNSRWLDFIIEEMQSSRAELRYEAARASGEIEDEEAVPSLLKLLNDSDIEVREAAIMALGKIGGTEAQQALQKLKQNSDPGIKSAAAAALAELQACKDPLSFNF